MAALSDRMRALVQPRLADFEPYDPAFTPTRINLSANENTYPMPAAVRAELDRALAATPLNRYPDPMSGELRAAIAERHGVEPRQVCVGNGGDELLFNFLFAFGGAGRTLLNLPPAFSEYELFAQMSETAVVNVWRDPATFEIPEDEALAAAAEADLVIVTSPNNPTGNLIAPEFAERLCAACRGLVMVDEAYIEFARPGASVQPLRERCPNLVILHTLSKAFGEAGIRCGYVLAAADVIDVFAAVRQIYSVNVLTQAAGLVAIRERAAFAPVVEKICAERARMLAGLEGLTAGVIGAVVWPSEGNFLLVRLPGAAEVRRRLRDDYDILVRDFSAAPGLAGCLRITVGTPEENDAVLRALTDLVKGETR